MEHAMPSTLITGANRGIGLEFVRQYLANGWQVYAACRDPGSASELHQLADTGNHKLRILALDVTDPFSIKAAAAELDGQAIDLLLNNAGVMGARGQTIGNIDYDAWAKVLDATTLVDAAEPSRRTATRMAVAGYDRLGGSRAHTTDIHTGARTRRKAPPFLLEPLSRGRAGWPRSPAGQEESKGAWIEGLSAGLSN
jgi:NAD(P)-dependent dehydrogenase (short-subunit alcohol dehydrogenase family)